MTNEEDLAAVARAIVDANLYMVLGTADKTGRPWVSPVYYAAEGYTELYWVSSPEARHSRNLATRPELSIVVFDSQAPIGTGQGVYMAGVADEPTAGDLERGITVYSRSSVAHGALAWKPRTSWRPLSIASIVRPSRSTSSSQPTVRTIGRR